MFFPQAVEASICMRVAMWWHSDILSRERFPTLVGMHTNTILLYQATIECPGSRLMVNIDLWICYLQDVFHHNYELQQTM